MLKHNFRNMSFIKKVREYYWKKYFKNYCSLLGTSPIIKGKVHFSGSGKMICGDKVLIQCETYNPIKIHIGNNANLKIGNQVFLNNGVQISCSQQITIGNHVDIADDCLILDNDYHSVGNSHSKIAPIIIENDVWLATRVIVLKGVTIGKGSVIGAGSVVTKSIPPNSFAAGVPAKVIRPI